MESENTHNTLPFKCSICVERFCYLPDLNTHLASHDVPNTYMCKFCTYMCMDIQELEAHVLAHNVNTPYSCGLCEDKFSDVSQLLQHLENDHDRVQNIPNQQLCTSQSFCNVSDNASQNYVNSQANSSFAINQVTAIQNVTASNCAENQTNALNNSVHTVSTSYSDVNHGHMTASYANIGAEQSAPSSCKGEQTKILGSFTDNLTANVKALVTSNNFEYLSSTEGHHQTTASDVHKYKQEARSDSENVSPMSRRTYEATANNVHPFKQEVHSDAEHAIDESEGGFHAYEHIRSSNADANLQASGDGFDGHSGSEQNYEGAGSNCPQFIEKQPCSFTVTENSLLQESSVKDIVVPRTDHMFSSYVKLEKISPKALEKQSRSESSQKYNQSNVSHEPNRLANTEDQINHQKLGRDPPGIILTELDKLKLCLSCCYPYSVSRGHDCLKSSMLSRKCGFCEVVFNNTWSLSSHSLKIHQERKNFCCVICSLVLRSEWDYIQHFINVHRKEIKSTTTRTFHRHTEHVNSVVSTVVVSQPGTKSRRFKGSPRKVVQRYDSMSHNVIDDSSDEDYHPENEDLDSFNTSDAVKMTDDNLAVDVPQGVNTADLVSDSEISKQNTEKEHRKDTRKITTLDTNTSQIAPGFKRNIPHGRIQSSKIREDLEDMSTIYSVCHNCCFVVKNILEHLKMHSHEDRLKCGFCGLHLKTEAAARHHYRNSHKQCNKINCNTCQWFGVSEKAYIKHCLMVHHRDMNLAVPKEHKEQGIDSATVQKSINLVNSIMKNRGRRDKSLLCRFCSVVSLNLLEHYKTHKNSDFLKCGFCLKTFPDREKVVSHFAKTHRRNGLACRTCSSFVGSEGMYIDHYLKTHTRETAVTSACSIPSTFTNENNAPLAWDKSKNDSSLLARDDDPNVRDRLSQPVFPRLSSRSNLFLDPEDQDRDTTDLQNATQGLPEETAESTGHEGPRDPVQPSEHQSIPNDASQLSICRHCCELHPTPLIKLHMKCHSAEERSQCGFCNKEFAIIDDVWRHQQKSHMDHLKCPFCAEELTSMDNYKDHFLQKHYLDLQNDKLKTKLRCFVCEFCGAVLRSKKTHNKIHNDCVTCAFCKLDFSRKSSVTQHFMEKHKGLKFLPCLFCQNFVGSLNKYIKHFLLCHSPGFELKKNEVFPVSDGEEEENQLSERTLQQHVGVNRGEQPRLKYHNFFNEGRTVETDSLLLDEAVPKWIPAPALPLPLPAPSPEAIDVQNAPQDASSLSVCRHCCQLHPTSIIKTHMRNHSLLERSQCGFCDKEFTLIDDVWRHQQKSHINQWMCPFCSEECASLDSYKGHFLDKHYSDLQYGRLKTKLRYFVCEFCGDVHKSRKLHNRTHRDSDFNKCGFCNSKFNRKSVVIQHFAGRHRDRRTLTCPICQQFIGSENKYIKHYLLNHTLDFMLQENQVFVSSDPEDDSKASVPALRVPSIQNENNQPIKNPANEFHPDDEEECVNENDEFQKYFVCEFCGEIHKSLKDHYPTHKDFTLCAFCDIELANKRNIQRHYKYKHKLRKNLTCKSCSVTIGSEKEYIDHCLQQHKRDESSDEDEFEKDLCSQIENVFQNPDGAQRMISQDDVTTSATESIAHQDVTLKNVSGKRRNDDASDTISKRFKKQPSEDHIGESNFDHSNMFSDDSNSMPSLPDFGLGDYDDDAEDDINPLDHEDTYTQITSKSSLLTKATNCAPIADKSDSSKAPSMTLPSRTRPPRRNSTIPASDLTDHGLKVGSTESSPKVSKQRRSFSPKASRVEMLKYEPPNPNWKGGTVCCNCSEVHLDINKHRLQHSSEILRTCGFCEKSFTRKMGTNEHYQFIHKNRQHLCCKFCKNFSKGTERSYIQHFLTVHRDIAHKAHTEAEIALMESNKAKINVSDELKEQPVHKSTAMDVCKHCGRVYPKSFLKTHVLQHTQETMNRCGFCTHTFKDPTAARSHYRTIHRDSHNLSCVYCSALVGTLRQYIDHYMKVHHGSETANSTPSDNSETSEQYSICEFCTDVVRGIHGHYQRHTLVDKLSCGFCGVKLATKNSVIRHYGAVHRDHEDLVCKRCSLKIGSEKKYIRHYIKRHLSEPSESEGNSKAVKDGQMCNNQLSIGDQIEASSNYSSHETKKSLSETHSDSESDSFEHIVPNEYKCGMCDEAFEQKYLLKMHRRVHSCARYKCDLCDVELFGEGDLNRHKRNVHNQQVEKQCDECGEVFPNTKKFRAHLKKHSDYYPFSCTECPKKFKEKINLCNHVKRFHTPDAKYRFNCSSCNKGFDNEGMYQSHLRIHTDERPFVCEICGNGFRTKISLKVHQNIHTDNRPYKCKFCGKGFRQQSTMQNHRRIHTGETPFMCHICGRSFHDRGHFHAHKKSSHKNDSDSTAPRKRTPNFKIPSQVPQNLPTLSHPNASVTVPNNSNSHTEMNTAVQSIIEPPPSQRAYPQHPPNVLDYQNYFSQMFYPQSSWMNQPK